MRRKEIDREKRINIEKEKAEYGEEEKGRNI